MKTLLLILLLLTAAAGCFGQKPASTNSIESVYLARDNGKGQAGDEVSEFGTGDIPIYCVVVLRSAARSTVKMNFVAVAVPGVKPDTKVVTTSYLTGEGENRVNFTGRPYGKWVPGRYRMELFVDGRLAREVEFNISDRPAPAEQVRRASAEHGGTVFILRQ